MKNNNASFKDRPSLEDCQAAERKLARFYKSFGIDALSMRDRLIDPFMDRAAAYWRPHAGLDFAALVQQEAEDELESWFAAIFGERLDVPGTAVMTGRAAFLMSGGPARFKDQLLRPIESLEDAFLHALIEHAPSAVPPSELGEMHHQPYEAWSPTAMMARALPIERVAGFSWRNTGSAS